MTAFTFAHFATGSKKVRSGKRRRASDDAFGGHHDRRGQHRRKGARLPRGHQLPACGAALAPFQLLTPVLADVRRESSSVARGSSGPSVLSPSRGVETPSSLAGSRHPSTSRIENRKEYSAFVLDCMAFLPPLVQTRRHATCSLTVASGVGPPTITSTYFFCPRGSGRTDKQPWHTFTLKPLWLRSRKSFNGSR